MAKTRKFVSYRKLEPKPYTRTSKYREKSFIRMTKNPRIVRWHMGNIKKKFTHVMKLVSKQDLQIRDLALESARMTANRVAEGELGKENYHFHLHLYPHHVLRENALASGAGADRLSTGMSCPFGKPIGVAARVRKGQTIMEIKVNKPGLAIAKEALRRAKTKLPGSYLLEVEEAKKVVKKVAKEPVKKAVEKKVSKEVPATA